MHKFTIHPESGSGPSPDLHGAHLLGADGVPVRGEVTLRDGVLVCESRSTDPLAVSLLWPVPGYGVVQLETTRLLERAEPYHLHVELARQRLMRISMKREEWGLFDFPGMEEIAAQIERGRDRFIAALQAIDDPRKAARLADESLSLSLRASEDMCRFHASVFVNRRQQSGGFTRDFLGATLALNSPKAPTKLKLTDVIDFVRIPFVWRLIQPKEQDCDFEAADALLKSALKAGLSVRGGPLLSFGVQSVPDWMYIWENDYEAILDFSREHIRRTIQHYGNQITNWTVATGLHADSVFPFTFEQIMDLTRMTATVAKQAAPRAQILLDLSQPWGEYYARNQHTVPPLLYAEMAVQSGIPFDAFGLQFVFGMEAEGFHLRDFLQVSALIDRLANLGKPMHITAAAVPSDGTAGGSPEGGWTEEGQADWAAKFCEIALSKPYVESVCWQSLIDGPANAVAGAGVLNGDGTPKPLYTRLAKFRAQLKANGRK